MEEIYKNTLLLINSLTRLSGICYKYKDDITEESVDKIVEIVDNCEKKFLQVKDEIVIMVQAGEASQKVDVEEKEEEIEAVQTKNGFLIKE